MSKHGAGIERTSRPSGQVLAGSSLPRLIISAAMTAAAGMFAAAFWAIARAQYVNDYCTTRARQPEPANPEALGGRPAYMPDPVTIRCEYDGFPTVDVFDPLPLLGGLVLAVAVAVLAFLMFRNARTQGSTSHA